MPFSYKTMGKVIRELREERDLPQEVVSGLAGIARSHLSMIETASMKASIETIWKITNAFDISLSDFFARVEKEMKSMK